MPKLLDISETMRDRAIVTTRPIDWETVVLWNWQMHGKMTVAIRGRTGRPTAG